VSLPYFKLACAQTQNMFTLHFILFLTLLFYYAVIVSSEKDTMCSFMFYYAILLWFIFIIIQLFMLSISYFRKLLIFKIGVVLFSRFADKP